MGAEAKKGVCGAGVERGGMALYLGIDGGGTKTEAVFLDETGQERGRGTGGPGNLATRSPGAVRESLKEAVERASAASNIAFNSQIEAVCAGMAGYSVEENRLAFEEALRSEVKAAFSLTVPDYEAAYWGATEGKPGIVVIAGTGAVAYGENFAGETQRFDGLGYLLGDRGSGFNLGLYGLRHALERLQLGDLDPLAVQILDHIGAALPAEALRWLYGEFDPAKVAGIAPIVGEFAEVGEPQAKNMVAEMARRLRHSVRQIRYGLKLPPEVPVYPMGGLWNLGAFLREEFRSPRWRGTPDHPCEPEALHGGDFVLAKPAHDAAVGAALRAHRLAAGKR